MILTPHFLLGVAIVSHVQPFPFALFLAFLSHFILDAVPHWDYSTKYIRERFWRKTYGALFRIGVDFMFGVALVAFSAQKLPLAFAGGLAAASPDTLTLLPILFPRIKIFQIYDRFHSNTHWFKNKKIPLFWKIFSQISVTALSLLFIA